MKLKIAMLAASVAFLASCGPSYRVTDQPNTDTTGTTMGSTKVPPTVQSAFSGQYANAGDVSWSPYDAATVPIDWELSGWPEISQSDYVATFTMDNNKYYAWYDANGNWVGSTYAISDYKTLPSAVSAAINDKFSGYSINSVHSEMQKDKMAYEIQLKNGDEKVKLLMDANGNILKQKSVTK